MKNLKRVFYLVMLGVMMYAPSVAAVSCSNSTNGDVILASSGKNITIDAQIPSTISLIIQILRIAIPVILVILGMVDLFKGVTAQKEDDIKKAQALFVKRLIAAAIVFFVITIVKFVISFANSKDSQNILDCADCFINGDCG